MQTLLTVFHIFLAIGLVGLVLIQHGKGADMGAAFGSGASGTVFGAKGSASFLTRTTAVLATLFFITSIAMGYIVSQSNKPAGIMEGIKQEAPAIPAPKTDTSATPDKSGGPVPMAKSDAEKAKGEPSTEQALQIPAAAQSSDQPEETKAAMEEEVGSQSPDNAGDATTPARIPQEEQSEQ
jgi:preprotein translocase subunit SecG